MHDFTVQYRPEVKTIINLVALSYYYMYKINVKIKLCTVVTQSPIIINIP